MEPTLVSDMFMQVLQPVIATAVLVALAGLALALAYAVWRSWGGWWVPSALVVLAILLSAYSIGAIKQTLFEPVWLIAPAFSALVAARFLIGPTNRRRSTYR